MVVIGEWLNDRHLQMICESRFCHNEVDEPRAYPFVVEQIQAVLQDFAEPSPNPSLVPRRHFCIVNSEANEGLHWFAVAWDGRLPRGEGNSLSPLERASWAVQNFAVRIVDSMETDYYCAPLVQALRNLGIEPRVDTLGTQGDDWRCGYHACWSLESMLKTKSKGFMTVPISPLPVDYTATLMEIIEDSPASPTVSLMDGSSSEPCSPVDIPERLVRQQPTAPNAPKPSVANIRPQTQRTRPETRAFTPEFGTIDPVFASLFAPRRNVWADHRSMPQNRVVNSTSIPITFDPWTTFPTRLRPVQPSLFQLPHPLVFDMPLSKRLRSCSSCAHSRDPFASLWF